MSQPASSLTDPDNSSLSQNMISTEDEALILQEWEDKSFSLPPGKLNTCSKTACYSWITLEVG